MSGAEAGGAPGQVRETVRAMFDRLAPRYDLTNTVLSFGCDRSWRRAAVRVLSPRPGGRYLDVACGTGALSEQILVHEPRAEVVGLDLSLGMLRRLAVRGEVRVLAADALALPFGDATFDGATVAFGVRNFADPVAGLREIARVCTAGAPLVVLEFGQPRIAGFSALYRLYSRRVLPVVGGWLTGDREAYRYLDRTASAFPCGERFLALAGEAGLAGEGQSLLGGAVWIYRLHAAGS
ncbi:MAG: ubiquinone/menaquinone biosynthesis methyltransferase [Planctomycetota bacterium]|nr:MAG: ubiquinone/menaquinone biosynthesis methyltransferase [Planctomycetota bacterium]